MAPPYTWLNSLQISSKFCSRFVVSGMLDSAGSFIRSNIIVPQICRWIPEFFRIFIQVSLASRMESEDSPLKIGSWLLTWSEEIFVWWVTTPLFVRRLFISDTLFLAFSFNLVSSTNADMLPKNSSPKLSSAMTVSADNSLHADCRFVCNLSALFWADFYSQASWLSSGISSSTNLSISALAWITWVNFIFRLTNLSIDAFLTQ